MSEAKEINDVEVVLINRCEQLMMDVFIHCITTEDYKPLIISGEPTAEQMQDAWNSIISEYSMLIGSDEFERICQLIKDINSCISKFNRIELYVRVLSAMYSEFLAKELRRLGYPGNYDPNSATYYEELTHAYNKAKTLIVTAQLKQNELKKIEARVEKGKLDRRHFDERLIELSSFNKYQVKEHEISAQKFCLMISSMNKYYERVNNKPNGRSTDK